MSKIRSVKRISKPHKYQTGGINPYTTGANLLGSTIENIAGDDVGGQTMSGALKGFAAGAALGPIGMIGGAAIGGLTSLISGQNKEREREALAKQQYMQKINNRTEQFRQNLGVQQQYKPTFNYGGMVDEYGFNRQYKLYPVGGEVKTTSKKREVAPADTSRIPLIFPKKPDILTDRRDKLASMSNINDPRIYEDLTPAQMSGYFSVLTEPTKGKTNAYTQRLLDNFNKRNPEMGFYYESDTTKAPSSLRQVSEGSKRFNELNTQYTKGINGYQQDTGRSLGSGMFGVKYPYGGDVFQPNAELETGEPYRTPDGEINQISNSAPSHAQGGVPMNLPQGTQILGKMKDPLTNKQFKKLGESLKRSYDKYTKILETRPTPLAKKTAMMMLQKNQQEYTNLMDRQESNKSNSNTFAFGGTNMLIKNAKIQKYPNGTPLQGTSEQSYNVGDPLYTSQTPTFSMSQDYFPASTPSIIQPKQQNTQFNLNNTLETLGALAPIGYNLAQGLFGRTKYLNSADYFNPYRGQIRSLMAGRRYDVSPELEANRLATSQYYQNLRGAAPSQSRYLAGLQSGQISRQRADASAYARKQAMDAEYSAQEAQMLSGLGQQESATRLNVEDINARRLAAKQQYLPTALSQLQQYALVNKQMRGQRELDKQRLAIAKEMFKNYPFDLQSMFPTINQ